MIAMREVGPWRRRRWEAAEPVHSMKQAESYIEQKMQKYEAPIFIPQLTIE